jgi:hypothetical protein
VDESRHTGPRGNVEQGACPLDVDPVERVRRRVVAVEGGDVHDGLATGDRALEARSVEKVDTLVGDVGASLAQLAGDVGPDEAGRARDVDPQEARARRTRPSAMTGQTSR